MYVVSLCGSLRPESSTQRALDVALAAAESAGAKVEALSLRDFDLPFCDGRSEEDTYGGDVARFRDIVAAADAILLGSPEYHGSLSGVLKNAIDLLGTAHMRGKMIGVLATARGDAGAMNTLNHLRHISRWVDAWVLPAQVSIPQAATAWAADGTIAREGLEEQLQRLGTELVRYCQLLGVKAP